MTATTRQYVDATGTIRRMQALARLGHTAHDIANAAQLPHNIVANAGRHPTIKHTTAAGIAHAYIALSVTMGTNNRTRILSAANMWAAPCDWAGLDIDNPTHNPTTITTDVVDVYADPIDVDTIIIRVNNGQLPVSAGHAEALAAARLLVRRGEATIGELQQWFALPERIATTTYQESQ